MAKVVGYQGAYAARSGKPRQRRRRLGVVRRPRRWAVWMSFIVVFAPGNSELAEEGVLDPRRSL